MEPRAALVSTSVAVHVRSLEAVTTVTVLSWVQVPFLGVDVGGAGIHDHSTSMPHQVIQCANTGCVTAVPVDLLAGFVPGVDVGGAGVHGPHAPRARRLRRRIPILEGTGVGERGV
jgi:hypothetical protein